MLKKNNKWITDGQRTRRRTGNSKIVAEWNVEIAQPASSIWLTHTWKSGRQADRHPFPFPFSTPVTHTLLPTLLPFLLERCAAAALYFSHLLSIFFRNSRSFFLLATSGLFLPCSPTFFTVHIQLCVCVYLGAFCGARFCVQVRSFNFDLCFRLFCVAFVDFCHLNRNFYFLHVPMAMAASFGFVFGWPAAAVASWPVFCACVVLARRFLFFSFFFLSFLFFFY